MLDVSFRSDEPESVLVYADGLDARIIRKLIAALGSEERAQNSLILLGAIAKLQKNGNVSSVARAKKVKESFRELVGLTYNEYNRLLEEEVFGV